MKIATAPLPTYREPTRFAKTILKVETASGRTLYAERRPGGRWKCLGYGVFWIERTPAAEIRDVLREFAERNYGGCVSISVIRPKQGTRVRDFPQLAPEAP